MNKHRACGATLGFVAAVTLTVILIGAGFFFLARIINGARELQNVTDAGSLNVAKQSLVRPTVKLFGPGPYDLAGERLTLAQKNFSECRDPATGQISLRTFNRVVAQATLVAINASVDNFPGPPSLRGIQNAQTLIDLIANQTRGIGTILANKLRSDQIMDDHFTALASIAPMRMLNPGGPAAAVVGANKNVSYMVRTLATNMRVSVNAIPEEYRNFIDPDFVNNNTIAKNGIRYLRGYSLINIPTRPLMPNITEPSAFPLMGVPLRPGERPHLVALGEFLRLRQSPLPAASQPGGSRVPSNAFKADGASAELKSSQSVQALACAIAGSINLQGDFPTSIPGGYIVVANGNGVTPSNVAGAVTVDRYAVGLNERQFPGGPQDIFTDILMVPPLPPTNSGGGVWATQGGALSRSANKLFRIAQWRAANPGLPVPPDLVNLIDGPLPKQAYADAILPNEEPVLCTHRNTPRGSPETVEVCARNFENMLTTYGYDVPDPGQGNMLRGLMAIENLKAQVINQRPYGGPAVISGLNLPAPGRCTGLKSFNLSGLTNRDQIDFGKPATINNLLQQFVAYGPTNIAATAISQQLLTRIFQIKPDAAAFEVSAILGSSLPMGAVKYIWMDDNRNLKFTDASGLPPRIDPNQILPDGTTTAAVADLGPFKGLGSLSNKFVNLDGERGYPKPWDCPPGDSNFGSGTVEAIFTRSSGFNGLLGVFRVYNCVRASGSWNCPC